jgi:hypothetical protein
MRELDPQSHPGAEQLALYSRKDLPWHRMWMLRRHVGGCDACRAQLHEVQTATSVLRRDAASTTLSSFEAIADWPALEREMLANIKVGLDAASCVAPVRRPGLPRLRLAMGSCALFVLATAGWWLNTPREETDRLRASLRRMAGLAPKPEPGSIVQTSQVGISVRAQGATLTLLNPAATPVTVSMAGSSAVAASFVDDQTGQVTITNVYGQ